MKQPIQVEIYLKICKLFFYVTEITDYRFPLLPESRASL